jgi:hypothetical protein
MLAVPEDTPATRPVGAIVATDGSLLVHDKGVVAASLNIVVDPTQRYLVPPMDGGVEFMVIGFVLKHPVAESI